MQTEPLSNGIPPDKRAIYWQATRAYSFPASIVSVLLGTALAARGYGGEARFDFIAFVLTLIGAVLAHAGGNVLNDFYDYRNGIDTRPEHGSGVLPQGLLSAREMWNFGVCLLLGGAVCALLLILRTPDILPMVLPLALLGLLCAVCYTVFLKPIALGDVTIMTAFGFGLTLGAYAVQTPISTFATTGLILWLALPLTLLVDGILHANNIRDAVNDSARGYRTLASLLGSQGSQRLQAVLLFGPLVLIALFVGLQMLPLTCLATLLVFPLLLKGFQSGDVPFIAQAHLAFGLLYAVSVAVSPFPV